jgi:hypothetical protein
MSVIDVWLDDARGMHLAHVDKLISLDLVHVVNNYGVISLLIPDDYDRFLVLDGMVEVWYLGRLESVGFIRKITKSDGSNGAQLTQITAYTGNYILTSRIVAYAAGSAQSTKTDYADDMIKAVVYDNLLAGAVTLRNIAGLSLTAAADVSGGVSITKSFAWKPLLDVCQDIADASLEAGTPVYFEFIPKSISASVIGFELTTWVNQRGQDHGSSSKDPVYIGKSIENLRNAELIMDYSDEANYIYAGGQGEEADRNVNQVSDSARYGASPWNRRERFTDARNESTDAGVTAKGYEALFEGRPQSSFSGEIVSTPSFQYGIHWGYGDKVIADYRGAYYDVLIQAIRITLASDGKISTSGKLVLDTDTVGFGI